MKRTLLLVFAASVMGVATPASADTMSDDADIQLSGRYVADLTGVASGGLQRGLRYLDNAEIALDLDLEGLFSWQGATVRAHLLSNNGGRPNDLAGTLQGIDNIEVPESRTKLYQLWLDQSFAGGRASLRLGLADLNAEFYQNDAAGLLMAAPFGIGSELAATGPNGPSIFPSTALTARLRVEPSQHTYVQAAVVNARAGVLGDRAGVDFSMRDGALLIAEGGWTGRGKVAAGFWRYTDRQQVLVPKNPGETTVSQGGYLLLEQPITRDAPNHPQIDVFARVGISEGAATPFSGGWQAGLLLSRLFPSRPHGQMSVGAYQGILTDRYRAFGMPGLERLASAETGFEFTYSDRLLPFLTVQPDVQYVRRPSADRNIPDAVIVALRLIVAYPPE